TLFRSRVAAQLHDLARLHFIPVAHERSPSRRCGDGRGDPAIVSYTRSRAPLIECAPGRHAAPSLGGSHRERAMKNWGMVVARGVLAIVFGLYALFAPGLALDTLIMLFGVAILVAGLLSIVAGGRREAKRPPAGHVLVGSIVCVAFGVLAFIRPIGTAVSALYVVSAFPILSGVVHIVAGLKLPKRLPGEGT